MDLDNILSTLPHDIRHSPAILGLAKMVQSLQEQLTKSQEKIELLEKELSRFRKTLKKPKFRSNGMEPRNRRKDSGGNGNAPTSMANSKLVEKEVS